MRRLKISSRTSSSSSSSYQFCCEYVCLSVNVCQIFITHTFVLISIILILIPPLFPNNHNNNAAGSGIFVSAGGNGDRSSSGWTSSLTRSLSGLTAGVTDMACYMLKNECCRPPYVRKTDGASILRKRLENEFFGQHLAVETVVTALDAHLQDSNPGKALVLSFHGWAGSGKTYLATMIIESLFKNGLTSSYVKFYMGSLNFPDPKKAQEYQDDLRVELRRVMRWCETAIFVFDEVDKTPPGVFDAIVPFIEYPGTIDALDHKKAIFIFLSNTGSNDITAITLRGWKAGKRREELTFKDYEDKLLKETFNNAESGLFKSRLIDRVLVDYFIPFLPMERRHILQCIEAEVKRHSPYEWNLAKYEDIADTLTYWPADIKLYSISGCKRIEAAVKYRIMKEKHLAAKQKEQDERPRAWEEEAKEEEEGDGRDEL